MCVDAEPGTHSHAPLHLVLCCIVQHRARPAPCPTSHPRHATSRARGAVRVSPMTPLSLQHEWSESERRRLQEEVHDLKGHIRVVCRVRPPLPSERDAVDAVEPLFVFSSAAAASGTSVEIVAPRRPGVDGGMREAQRHSFAFNR